MEIFTFCRDWNTTAKYLSHFLRAVHSILLLLSSLSKLILKYAYKLRGSRKPDESACSDESCTGFVIVHWVTNWAVSVHILLVRTGALWVWMEVKEKVHWGCYIDIWLHIISNDMSRILNGGLHLTHWQIQPSYILETGYYSQSLLFPKANPILLPHLPALVNSLWCTFPLHLLHHYN